MWMRGSPGTGPLGGVGGWVSPSAEGKGAQWREPLGRRWDRLAGPRGGAAGSLRCRGRIPCPHLSLSLGPRG